VLNLKTLVLAVAVSAATIVITGCNASVDAIDDVPPGSEVSIATEDGRVIDGDLVDVSTDQVVVATRESGDVALRRDAIVSAKRTDDAKGLVGGWFAGEAETIEIQVPEGTKVLLTLQTPLSSKTSAAEDEVRATVREPLMVGGHVAVPAGSTMTGEVTGARPSGEVKGRARLAFRFTGLETYDERHDVTTNALVYEAEGTTTEDAAKIGIGAAAGAIIGGIADGGKGAAIGSAIGGGAGTAVVLMTPGEEVSLPSGAPLTVELQAPIGLSVPRDAT
jgi:hypothetical protein